MKKMKKKLSIEAVISGIISIGCAFFIIGSIGYSIGKSEMKKEIEQEKKDAFHPEFDALQLICESYGFDHGGGLALNPMKEWNDTGACLNCGYTVIYPIKCTNYDGRKPDSVKAINDYMHLWGPAE